MRRALLFMIFLNSITFVTNNLAMDTDDDIEIQTAGDDSEIPLLNKKNRNPDSDNSAEQPSLLKKCSLILKKCCPGFLGLVLVATPPILSTTLGDESMSGIDGMANTASPITLYPTNNTHPKSDCTYAWHDDFDYPSGMACMQGACNVTYEYPPGCNPKEQSIRSRRGGGGRGGSRSCGRGGKMRRVRCTIERCKGADQFEKECTKARDCGYAQMITVPIAWLVSSIASCCLGRKSKNS